MTVATDPPDALLLLTSSCPHCPGVLQGLGDLVKQGIVARLEVVNIERRPDIARQHGVRSVPWFRIGNLEFEGAHTPAELRQWAERASSVSGEAEYFHELLKSGQLDRVARQVRQRHSALVALLHLLGDTDTELTVRIGVNAVFEGLEGDARLADAVAPLEKLLAHRDAHVRGDAAHLLSHTHRPEARRLLEPLLQDENADVRDIAREGIERLDARA